MFEFKKNRYTPKLLIELHNTTPHYSAHEICQLKDYEKKTNKKSKTKKNNGKQTRYLNVKAPSKQRQIAIR